MTSQNLNARARQQSLLAIQQAQRQAIRALQEQRRRRTLDQRTQEPPPARRAGR